MVWLWALFFWRICSCLSDDNQRCRLQFVNKEKTTESCGRCERVLHPNDVCRKATGRPHRLGHLSVLPSEAKVPILDNVDNKTLVAVDITGDYTPSTTGYMLIFTLDSGADVCLSVVFPRCNESLASFSLTINGICSYDPEIHKLSDVGVVQRDWISDVIIGRSNSSYLKITYDVKSRNVKWYAVELWDYQNNLIMSEKTEKNYVIFRHIAEGTYYAVVSILEMMEDAPSPCGRDVKGMIIPGTCTAKRSRLFEYPLRKTADRDLTSTPLSGFEVSVIVGGILLLALVMLTLTWKYHKCLCLFRNKSFSTRSVTIIATTSCRSLKELLKTLRKELNVECNRQIISKEKYIPFSKISSDIVLVIISREMITCLPTLFGEPEKFNEKTIVFVEGDTCDYDATNLPNYPIFNIVSSCDRLVKFLALKIGSQDKYLTGKIRQLKSDSNHHELSTENRISSFDRIFDDSRYSVSPNIESVSKIIDSGKLEVCTTNNDRYSIHDTEVSTVFSNPTWILPSDRYSDSDSAYVTQSECMKQINDLYDASRESLTGNKLTSEDMEAISLGERSV